MYAENQNPKTQKKADKHLIYIILFILASL